MLHPIFTPRFRRELRRMEARGKDSSKLRPILLDLLAERPLDERHRDHKLQGAWAPSRECHVEPDWLLVYRVEGGTLYLERTGTHQDLFGR